MVTIPASFRNLTQVATNVSLPVAAATDLVVRTSPPRTEITSQAIDALTELLSGTALVRSETIKPAGPRREEYETTGYTDLLSQLWALVDRPVGKAVRRTYQTQAVETPFGTVYTEVQTGSEYVRRPLTPEERLYLQRKGWRMGLRPMPGDLDYLTRRELR